MAQGACLHNGALGQAWKVQPLQLCCISSSCPPGHGELHAFNDALHAGLWPAKLLSRLRMKLPDMEGERVELEGEPVSLHEVTSVCLWPPVVSK